MNQKNMFSSLIRVQAEKYGDRPVMYDRNKLTDPWQAISWNEMNEKVERLANAMIELGVGAQDRIAQFSQNKSENLIVDFAAYAIRAVVVPIYPTSTLPQLDFITTDAETSLLFVGEQRQYDIAVELMKTTQCVRQIVVFEKEVKLSDDVNSIYFDEVLEQGKPKKHEEEVAKRRKEGEEADMTCLLYTSGTTGNPKGVVLTNEMFNEAMRIHLIRLSHLNENDTSLSFLPMTHVFERMWCYFLLNIGAVNYINHNPADIQTSLKDVRPTLMCAVPRLWEKINIGVRDVLEHYTPFKLGMVTWAIAVGKERNIDYIRVGKKPDWWLTLRYKLAEKLIFSKLKTTLGLENARALPVAGAKLSDEISQFFLSIGVPIVYGYGLTESTATVSCYESRYEIGTVGTLMPNVEVKIGEDNEILLRGKTISKAYYNNPKANQEAFTADGWFRTGDAGFVKNNMLTLTERIKDLFKTSNGKYIAPQEIESRLGNDKYIEQVAVIGNERNFVSAIIAPSIPALQDYAKSKGIEYMNLDGLLTHPEIIKMMDERIAERQKGMANYEIVKKFTLVKAPFTIETGELTNTLKIRRAVIMQKYKAQIDAMYS